MTWPSALTKTNFDDASDDPKQARSEFASNVDKVNQLISHVSSLAQTFLADTTASSMRSTLDASQAINSMTAETAPATGDLVGLRDASAGADRKMTLANVFKVINLFTQDNSPDGANDFLVSYDASAGTPKKVLINDLSSVFTESFTSAEQTITAGGSLSLSHSLSGKPNLHECRLVCKTAELGYSIGDEVVIPPYMAGGNRGASVVPTNSTVDIRYGSDASTYSVPRKDNGNFVGITNGSWRLVVRAWR